MSETLKGEKIWEIGNFGRLSGGISFFFVR
jgi:hypothetical protein